LIGVYNLLGFTIDLKPTFNNYTRAAKTLDVEQLYLSRLIKELEIE